MLLAPGGGLELSVQYEPFEIIKIENGILNDPTNTARV